MYFKNFELAVDLQFSLLAKYDQTCRLCMNEFNLKTQEGFVCER